MATATQAYDAAKTALARAEQENLPIVIFTVGEDGAVKLISNVPTHLLPELKRLVLGALACAENRYGN